MKIIGTGLTGLVGSRIIELLNEKHQFENLSTSTGIDITDSASVLSHITSSDASVVLHLAAKANVDACEEDKALGKDGEAWKINVNGTQHIVRACEETAKRLIYISTDFVFDGQKEIYTEEDIPNPINWYAQTKYEGEKVVQLASIPWVIARIAYPYRAQFNRNDFVRAVKGRLEKQESVTMITDHIMTPTFIDDIALAIAHMIMKEAKGIYHIVGSEWVSPFEAANLIAEEFGYNRDLIQRITHGEYFKNKAPRPFHLALENDKIQQLGIRMKTFKEGIHAVKEQLL